MGTSHALPSQYTWVAASQHTHHPKQAFIVDPYTTSSDGTLSYGGCFWEGNPPQVSMVLVFIIIENFCICLLHQPNT